MLQRDLQWIKERVSAPLKYDLFLKKLFVADGKQTLGKFFGDCFKWGINDQITPRAREFHKYIFQYSEHYSHSVFCFSPIMKGCTL